MHDLLDHILALALTPADEGTLLRLIADHAAAVEATPRRSREVVERAEDEVAANPEAAFTFDQAGNATLTAMGQSWHAGRFEVASIAQLRTRAKDRGPTGGQVRLWVFDGGGPITDIASLQATNGTDTLFQVASQFNCLESPGEYVAPVKDYFSDYTQGPRASISAFPATLLRHYRAPGHDDSRFVQRTGRPQVELLAACAPGAAPNGYLTGIDLPFGERQLLPQALEIGFESIQVGVHDDVQVVRGYNWDSDVPDSANRRIAQVFTSTAAGGGYGAERNFGPEGFRRICRSLLRGAYLGTLLAAAALGKRRAVLTLIGGGVFGNPTALIWDSIQWACHEVRPSLSRDLDVIVNGYNIGRSLDMQTQIAPVVRQWGGAALAFWREGCSDIWR